MSRGPGRTATWAAAALLVALILWMGVDWDYGLSKAPYAGRKNDYYSSLVHGFLSGHLYMDHPADPRLASPDPSVRRQAPTLQDATYFKGHYYLYFGVTPAALVLLPYARLTGGDLDPRLLVVGCAVAGFLFALATFGMAARDHFGDLGAAFQVPAAAALALATAVPSLLTRAMFYELAVASGYAFTMAGLFWIYRALFRSGRKGVQLAFASVNLGLAVGCRPDLVFNVAVLAPAALIVALHRREGIPFSRALLRAGIAAFVPAAAVGAALATYNYERFGSPTDFGVTHVINYFMMGDMPLFSRLYLWPNIHWYYLTPPSLSPYFPYVLPEQGAFGPPWYRSGEVIHGQLVVTVLCVFVALAALAWRRRIRIRPLAAYLAILAWMFVAPLVSISTIGFRGDRYQVDCQGALVLGAVLLAGAVSSGLGKGMARASFLAGFGCLALAASLFNLLGGLQQFEAFRDLRPATYRALESWGDYPAYWLGRLGVFKWGPIELRVSFPAKVTEATIEPLLAAGTPDFTDALYVIQWPPGGQIQLVADHSGYGGPKSEILTIDRAQVHTVSVDMGALYPPFCPPFTSGKELYQQRLLKSGVRISFDGKTAIDKKMNAYDAPPWSIETGRNDITMNPYRTLFQGKILSQRRTPPPTVMAQKRNGLVKINCTFPLGHPQLSFPLVSAGQTGSGTLIYLNVLPGNRVRFGADEWNLGGGMSGAIDCVPGAAHEVEIFIGTLARQASWPQPWKVPAGSLERAGNTVNVWLDGQLVWTTRLKRPIDAFDPEFDFGTNRQGFSTAEPDFLGDFESDPFLMDEARDFLARNLDGAP